MTRQPFTGHEHILVGRRLCAMRDDLLELQLVLHSAYGSAMARKVEAIRRGLDKLRSDLDGQVSREHPMDVHDVEGVPITHVYYGQHLREPSRPGALSTATARERLRVAAAGSTAS